MIRISVLAGGQSDEREVSLRSGAAVRAALERSGYQVAQLDPQNLDTRLSRQLAGSDVVFPVLHGKGGEDGRLQQWLEDRQLAFIGADAAASELCFDKWRYKQKLLVADVYVPRGVRVKQTDLWQSELARVPFVLKPYDGGSSVDTFIVRDPADCDKDQLADAFSRHPEMLLEELIEGSEITVGVLGDRVLPVIEIIPPVGGEFDYNNKYNGRSAELCPPQHISPAAQAAARDLALRIHHLCGVRDMSRTDMIVAPSGKLYVLETNTIPGLTDQSLLPKAAAQAGYDMPALCRTLVEFGLARKESNETAFA